tara:strand:- start:918 stop:1463 length:546 start_codon:yes stop_codon:yes gene_type:complete
MDTLDNVLVTVRNRNLPYWKLYKGTTKVAQCDADENPNASPEEAFEQLKAEIGNRTAGNYNINVYKRLKGESGGFRYEFSINQNSNFRQNANMSGGFNAQDIYAQAQRDLEIKASLDRIEKQNEVIIQALIALNDDDDDNDGKMLQFLGSFLGKGVNAAKAATTAAKAGAVSTNGFGSMKI